MKDRYLITGATGFIGSNVVRHLVNRGETVSIITRDRKPSWRLSDVHKKLHIYTCGLMDPGLQKVVDKVAPTIIFHFAAYGVNPWETELSQMIDTNIRGTHRLIESAKKHHFRLFINTGTSSEYGVKNKPMKETDYLEPVNDYGVTKAAATMLCTKIGIKERLPVVTFRLFSPFGYFEHKKRLFPSVTLSALSSQPIAVSTPGHVRDFVFIDDVVRAYMLATRKTCPPGSVLNIAGGREHTVGEVVKRIVKVAKSTSRVAWGAVNDQGRQVEPALWQADIAKAKKKLGWEPRITFDEGIKKTVSWFGNHKALYE